MKKPTTKKLIIIILIIIGYVLFSYFWLEFGSDLIRINYDPHDPTQQFIGVLIFTIFAIFFKKVKELMNTNNVLVCGNGL